MYMYAPTGIADALGQPAKPPLAPELRAWLKRVRAHPENFEMLLDRKSTRLNSSHLARSRMPSSA